MCIRVHHTHVLPMLCTSYGFTVMCWDFCNVVGSRFWPQKAPECAGFCIWIFIFWGVTRPGSRSGRVNPLPCQHGLWHHFLKNSPGMIYTIISMIYTMLRSSTDRSCAVPRTHSTFGDRSFAVAGARVWNSLPAQLCDEDISYNSFRRELKKTYWV